MNKIKLPIWLKKLRKENLPGACAASPTATCVQLNGTTDAGAFIFSAARRKRSAKSFNAP